jgi:hypothetical protein
MEEVAIIDERVEELNGRVVTLQDEMADMRMRYCSLDLLLEAERQTWRTLERSFIAHQELFDRLMGEVGAMQDDHAKLINHMVRGFSQRRAEVALQPLVEYKGYLVPIGTVELPINLTDSSEDIVSDSEAGKVVVGLAEEEEAQARDAGYQGELTFHMEVEAACQDLTPEYDPAPEYTESE